LDVYGSNVKSSNITNIIFIFLLFSVFLISHANIINDNLIGIQKANNLAQLIHAKHSSTFYCNCIYNNKIVDLKSCGYKIQKNQKRAKKLECEHIVPVSVLAKNLPCWTRPLCCNNKSCYKGRTCCQKIDPIFLKMATDLHNIVPIIGELNGIRSNYGFSELPHIKPNQFGCCHFKIDRKNKKVEPRSAVKGIIARTYLYMANSYQITLSQEEQKLFLKWNKQYPPTTWELNWNKRAAKIQHNDNFYISKYYNQ